jgi:hypothetical protein
MPLPNIVLLGNFGVLTDIRGSPTFRKFLPFALKYYDQGLNAHFELKQDLSFTWYQKRNMTAKLLKQKPVDTGLLDRYVNVVALGFEQEQTAVLSHEWQNQITDADFPPQEDADVWQNWTNISAGETELSLGFPYGAGWSRLIVLICNFNATNPNIQLKLFPTEKVFNYVLEQGKCIGFYVADSGGEYSYGFRFLKIVANVSGFKWKVLHTNQTPTSKIFNVKFQEFQDTGIPPSVPASNEIDGDETAIYLFNLTA